MNRTKIAALSAVAALALTAAGWLGYQQLSQPQAPAEALTTYNPGDPAEVAASADGVFTATVQQSNGQATISDVPWDLYQVDVQHSRKGHRTGSIQVAVEQGGTPLRNGGAYVFATNAFEDVSDGHAQATSTEPVPADERSEKTWATAVQQG